MASMQFKPSKMTLITGLFLAGCAIFLIPQSITGKLNFAFINVFGYFLNIGSSAVYYQSPQQLPEHYVSRHQYNQLQVAYANLQAQLLEQKNQIQKLGQFRLADPDASVGLVLAKITNRRNHEFIVNAGTADAVAIGQYVLGDNAVIGYVSQVSENLASIALLSSSACRLAVKIAAPQQGLYYNGTLHGNDKLSAKIPNVPSKYKISKGDYVYAAPKNGVLQTAKIIGRVADCKIDSANPVLWDISVDFAYDFDNLTDVAIIILDKIKN